MLQHLFSSVFSSVSLVAEPRLVWKEAGPDRFHHFDYPESSKEVRVDLGKKKRAEIKPLTPEEAAKVGEEKGEKAAERSKAALDASSPERAEKDEAKRLQLQNVFESALGKFRIFVKDAAQKTESGTYSLMKTIKAYRDASTILNRPAREIARYLADPDHLYEPVLLKGVDGDKISASEIIQPGRILHTLEWARVAGVEREARVLLDAVNQGAHKFLAEGMHAISSFESQDLSVLLDLVNRTEDLDELRDHSKTLRYAVKTLEGYQTTAQALKDMFGHGPLADQCDQLMARVAGLKDERHKAVAQIFAKLDKLTGQAPPKDFAEESPENPANKLLQDLRRRNIEKPLADDDSE